MEIFKSRRFWSAVIGLVAMVVSSLVPELRQHIDIIVPGIVGIVGILIGGYSIEDAMLARSGVVSAISGPAYEVTEKITIEEAQG